MEISAGLQQNINKEIIPKDLKEASNLPQGNNGNLLEGVVENSALKTSTDGEINTITQGQNISFKEQLDQLNNQNSIYDFSFDVDFAGVFSLSANETSEEDLSFFLDILEKNKKEKTIENIGLIPIVNNIQNINETSETTNVKATEKVFQIVEMAAKTEKPVRIDFDNQITVVLKVDNTGKINAHFYPGDKAAEEYLRNNIQNLRDSFDKKNILYSYLDYKQNGGNNGKERKQR